MLNKDQIEIVEHGVGEPVQFEAKLVIIHKGNLCGDAPRKITYQMIRDIVWYKIYGDLLGSIDELLSIAYANPHTDSKLVDAVKDKINKVLKGSS